MYVDRNGDHVINDLDKRAFHTPTPRWILGHTSNFRWHGVDAGATLRAYLGNYTYNNVASNLGAYSVLTQGNAPANLSASVLKYGFESQQLLNDVFVEDASFLRIDNLTLGYSFPLRSAQTARAYFTVQNVWTSTKYTGVDPTAGVNGIDNNIYPRSRNFVGGLSIGF
jgi:iron complex outermembrane receptor protein